jgi:hypothetical protein
MQKYFFLFQYKIFHYLFKSDRRGGGGQEVKTATEGE